MPKLSRFFVFNPDFGPTEEREAEKLLFYWPNSTAQNDKGNDVGLSQAITNFSGTFSDEPCDILHLQKHTYAFLQAEPNYWFVLIAENDSSVNVDDPKQVQWDESSVLKDTLQPILVHAYEHFKLFNGCMSSIVQHGDVDVLRQCLAHCLTPFVASLRLESVNFFDALDGVQFLPVEKTVYLRLQSFVNLAEQTFPMIEETALLYHEHLVWSGMSQETTRTLYRHVVTRLRSLAGSAVHLLSQPDPALPVALDQAAAVAVGDDASHLPPLGYEADDAETWQARGDSVDGSAPLVRGLGAPLRRLYVWRCDGFVCAWLIRSGAVSRQLCERLQAFAEPHARFVGPALAAQRANAYSAPASALGGSGAPHRFVYFNHMNLALKTSLHNRGQSLAPPVMRAVCDARAVFAKQESGELMLKLGDDVWVVGRKADSREFVVFFDRTKGSTANVIEISDEVQRLCQTFFVSVFLSD